jgi:hypothetical protein
MAERDTDGRPVAVIGMDIARWFQAGIGNAKLNVDEYAPEVDVRGLVEESARAFCPPALGAAVVRGFREFPV